MPHKKMYKPDSKSWLWDNKLGFTLIEVMVTAAMVAIIGMIVVGQTNLINNTKKNSGTQSVVNAISNRLAMVLSNEAACSANFANKTLTYNSSGPAVVTTVIKDTDLTTTLIQTNDEYPLQFSASLSALTGYVNSQLKLVKINAIKWNLKNSTETNQAILRVEYSTSSNLGKLVGRVQYFDLPLHVIMNGSTVVTCFADSYYAIMNAVKESCEIDETDATQIDSFAKYVAPTADQTDNRFGKCVRAISTSATSPVPRVALKGQQFIKAVSLDTTTASATYKKLVFSIPAYLKNVTPSGWTGTATDTMVVNGFVNDGTLSTTKIFPKCDIANGYVLGYTGGKWQCIKITCTTYGTPSLLVLSGINSDGSANCQPIYNAAACSPGWCKTFDANGNCTSCDSAENAGKFTPVTCAPNEGIYTISATGVPSCRPFIAATAGAGGNRIASVDSAGNPVYKASCMALMCAGAYSPGGKTKTDCGGSYYYVDAGTQFCRTSTASCTGGFNNCGNWGTSGNTVSCTDSYSGNLCTSYRQTQTVAAKPWGISGAYLNLSPGNDLKYCRYLSAPWGNTSGCNVANATYQTIQIYNQERGCY